MKWLEDALDSYGWLEMCFFADEEMILDELAKRDYEVNWDYVLQSFTSADFQDEYTVVFTLSEGLPVPVGYVAKQLRQVFLDLYDQQVAITVLRDKTS